METFAKQISIEYVDAQALSASLALINRQIAELYKPTLVAAPIKLLTRKETATLLKISLPTLNSWTKQGFLKSYRLGRMLRYKEGEVLGAPIPTR